MQTSIRFIYASTSGHTEFVIDTLIDALKGKKDLIIKKQRAEQAQPEDLLSDDITILASSTWNTGNVEGQMNPHMYNFLMTRAKDVDLKGRHFAAIGLGDERYHFIAKAKDHLILYISTHGGSVIIPPLVIVNEPYSQEKKVRQWSEELCANLKKLPDLHIE